MQLSKQDALYRMLARGVLISIFPVSHILLLFHEVRNPRVTKSNYETKLHKMMPHFELLTQTFLKKFFFRVTNSTS